MSIRSISVLLNDDGRRDVRLSVAMGLCRAHGARLTALYDHSRRAKAGEASVQDVKSSFLAATNRENVTAEWREVDGTNHEAVRRQAHLFDLIVIGQPDARGGGGGYGLPEDLILTAGRPVLIIPYAGEFKSLGERVLVAWNGTREATRAVYDSLPILAKAKQAVVYWVNPPEGTAHPGTELVSHLVLHGVKAEAHHTRSALPPNETAVIGARSMDVGSIVLSAAADLNSDLIVMGAYSHSRVRELVLGGATRHILHHMTVPVLMSH